MTDATNGDASDVPIRVRGLHTAFGEHVVHEDLDLDVRRGEILAVVGGSGSGKSVLLNTILGLKKPDNGAIEVFGRDLSDDGTRDELERRAGVLFQNGALYSTLTVLENVEAPFLEHIRLPPAFVRDLARLKIGLVGLEASAADKRPADLSGGMRKRAGMARAIALDPDLLFLDEPTAGLDPVGAESFDTLVRDLRDAMGLTVLMITHDLDSIYAISDRVAVLADRHVAAIGPLAEVEQSDHPWIREYFGGLRGRAAKEKQS